MTFRWLAVTVAAGCLLAGGLSARAQADTGNPALYTERLDASGRHGEVLFVADDGTLATVPVPDALYPAGYPDSIVLGDIVLSPDGSHLAAAFYEMAGGNALPLMIADLTRALCCTFVAAPLAEVYSYDLSGFSPDGTQLAFSFVGSAEGGAIPYTGGMALADTVSGALTEVVSMDEAMTGIGQPPSAIWAFMGPWTDPGIEWTPNCYACEGVYEAEYSLWLPHKGSFVTHSGDYFSLFADNLAVTDETLYAGQSSLYPVSPEPAMLPIPNVIQYLGSGIPPTFATLGAAPVVYFDVDTLDLGDGAHWVVNGDDFLVTPPNRDWTLVSRAGLTRSIPAPAGADFLMGTVDGWLAAIPGPSGVDLVRYVNSPAGPFGAVIDRTQARTDYRAGYIGLYAPPLGEGVAPVAPPTVPPPAVNLPTPLPPVSATPFPAVVQCPGFLPSRLVPGQLGRVTPGDANNLRALPNVSAPLVGRMPGSAEFVVMTGPVCDPAGLAWWQVTYSGLIGWTVEGQGNTYFLEPVSFAQG